MPKSLTQNHRECGKKKQGQSLKFAVLAKQVTESAHTDGGCQKGVTPERQRKGQSPFSIGKDVQMCGVGYQTMNLLSMSFHLRVFPPLLDFQFRWSPRWFVAYECFILAVKLFQVRLSGLTLEGFFSSVMCLPTD